jgi:hypothetical protein
MELNVSMSSENISARPVKRVPPKTLGGFFCVIWIKVISAIKDG